MDSTPNSFYLIVDSGQSLDLFPDNTGSDFYVYMAEYLDFSDYTYDCALVDFSCTSKAFEYGKCLRPIQLCLDLVEYQSVCGIKEQLLRSTTVSNEKYQAEKFPIAYYIPVRQLRANSLHIWIKDGESHEVASFLHETTTCTLHFRRRSKRRSY